MGFEVLLGNEQLKKDLSGSIRRGSLSHCYLISGPEGSGKRTLARLIAGAALCREERKPCGTCPSCRKLREGNHPDFITVEDPEHKNVAVKLVREYRADIFVMPNESERKVYLFPQDMGIEGQNALLKVLEEPPRYVTIILLARECDRILTTIKSRAQYVAMSRFEDSELAKRLLIESADARAIKATDEERFLGIIMSADGRLGLAKKLVNKRLVSLVIHAKTSLEIVVFSS